MRTLACPHYNAFRKKIAPDWENVLLPARRGIGCAFPDDGNDHEEKLKMDVKTLDQLSPGQSASVKRISGGGALRRRLLDMGLTSGTKIAVVKASPLGDPVEYLVRGYHLSLRKSEAEMIEVTL